MSVHSRHQQDPARTAPGSVPEHVGPSSDHSQLPLKVLDPSLQAAWVLGLDLDPACPIDLLGSSGPSLCLPTTLTSSQKKGAHAQGEVGNRALRVEGRAPGGQAGLVSEDGNRAKHTHGGAGSWPLTPQGRAPKAGTAAPAPAPGGPHTPTLRPGRVDSWAWKGPSRLPWTPRSVPELCSPLSL